MDYLKDLASQLKGKIKKQNLFDANNGHSTRSLIVKEYKDYHFRIDEFDKVLKIGVKIECDFSFSINNPDIIFVYKAPFVIERFPYTLFFSKTQDPFLNEQFSAFWKAVESKIKNIPLSTNESIFVYRNWIQFALNSNRNALLDIDRIIELVNTDQVFKKRAVSKLDTKNIPNDLKTLMPLMKKFAISDDAEREELIENISPKQKIKLIDSIEPHVNSINEFLNSFGDKPLTDEAILLGNLAELVSELNIEQ